MDQLLSEDDVLETFRLMDIASEEDRMRVLEQLLPAPESPEAFDYAAELSDSTSTNG